MRLAILSDIHGNLEAFESVRADIRLQGTDGVICLGDMIGYGPDPEDVIQGVRDLQCRTVLGNHEASLFSGKARSRMNFQARENSIRMEHLISEKSLAYCRNLPSFLHSGEAWYVHGYPPDSVFIYLFNQSDQKIADLFDTDQASLYFVGHTHDLRMATRHLGEVYRSSLTKGRIRLEKNNKYIINVGSVGQPRDGSNQAKYVIWDDETRDLEIRFIPYDISKTVQKIHARGFPAIYAERLV
ncbi:MAG: metallophosphoesterase family protein [Desulfocapsaceae bacterium]|nr:metallophosphoesterase family protein [Desulfocapsaceae bacterium]